MPVSRFQKLILATLGAGILLAATAGLIAPPAHQQTDVRYDADVAEKVISPRVPQTIPDFYATPVQVSALSEDVALQSQFRAKLLAQSYERMGYELDAVRQRNQKVPRVFLAKLPTDLAGLAEVREKKAVFFKSMLPLILRENERILAARTRLQRIHAFKQLGQTLDAPDRLWLMVLAERYRLKTEDTAELLARVDIVPPSLALAQAAEESGWGTSRFAREGNAMFGQWTSGKDAGLVPESRSAGKQHKIKAFDTVQQSVSAYMRNLNSHRAYGKLRQIRQQFRSNGEPPEGRALAEGLKKYSERGEAYVRAIHNIMRKNKLSHLDGARLHEQGDADIQA